MKNICFTILLFTVFSASAQQWQWAISADSVFGSQETKMICRNGDVIYALLYQHGPSVFAGSYVDSGSVIIKVTTNGNILWAKQYPGIIETIYADKNDNIYFTGFFTDSLDFLGTLLISHGSRDIFFGLLDANTGAKLWASSAGTVHDEGPYYAQATYNPSIITDNYGNLFIAVRLHDDFYIGNQSFSGYAGMSTYLLRCDLNGNLIQAFSDTMLNNLNYYDSGIDFEKSVSGTIYLNALYDEYNCPYYCEGHDILKITPYVYTLSVAAHLTTSFEYLASWSINPFDETIDANFNTGSHYFNSYDLFHYASSWPRVLRKYFGNGYDGKIVPLTVCGIGDEIVLGGYYDNDFIYYGNQIDTLWFDSLFLLPDSLPHVMLGGLNSTNQHTWMLHSEGSGSSTMKGIASDMQGHIYCAGNYNIFPYLYYLYEDSIPDPITFGNTTLPAENLYTRFFLAAAGTNVTSVQSPLQNTQSAITLFPNPTHSSFTVHCSSLLVNGELKIYNSFGALVHQQIITSPNPQIDLSVKPGVYFVEMGDIRKKLMIY